MIFQSVKFKIIESLKISYINKIHYQEIIINIPDWIKIPFKQRNFHFYSLYFCSKEGLINVDSKATTSTKTIIFQFYYYSTLEKYKKEIRVSISPRDIPKKESSTINHHHRQYRKQQQQRSRSKPVISNSILSRGKKKIPFSLPFQFSETKKSTFPYLFQRRNHHPPINHRG